MTLPGMTPREEAMAAARGAFKRRVDRLNRSVQKDYPPVVIALALKTVLRSAVVVLGEHGERMIGAMLADDAKEKAGFCPSCSTGMIGDEAKGMCEACWAEAEDEPAEEGAP